MPKRSPAWLVSHCTSTRTRREADTQDVARWLSAPATTSRSVRQRPHRMTSAACAAVAKSRAHNPAVNFMMTPLAARRPTRKCRVTAVDTRNTDQSCASWRTAKAEAPAERRLHKGVGVTTDLLWSRYQRRSPAPHPRSVDDHVLAEGVCGNLEEGVIGCFARQSCRLPIAGHAAPLPEGA
jgi:hypothetical protein